MHQTTKNSFRITRDTYRNFFENTLDGIFQTSLSGDLLTANPALVRIAGFTSLENMKKECKNFANTIYVTPGRRADFLRIMKKKGQVKNFESKIYRKDGSIAWISENAWNVRNKKGEVTHFEGTVHDITMKKKVEEERERFTHEQIARLEAERTKEKIAELYKKAKESIHIRDEFLNIASHELKTPLTSLHLQIQMMGNKSKRSPEKKISKLQLKSSIEKCEQQTKRLTTLINNLLDVSRMTDKKFDIGKEKVNLTTVTREVLSRLQEPIKASGSTIILKNGKKIVGAWDRLRIDQLATNLITNALKYGGGKPITVIVDKEDYQAKLIVKDHGRGISAEDLRKIFDRFERSSYADDHSGLGLGLYIVKKIVNAHGGSIDVKSEPEKGSEFIVTLPLTPN